MNLKEKITNDVRYENFTLLDKAVPFNELFKNKNFDLVQVHSTDTFKVDGGEFLVGFFGAFKWENNEIVSLDGDNYSRDFKVLGYEKFITKNANKKERCIDVLVGDSW